MLKKINLLLSIALLLSSTLVAQVTTSNISCVVKTSSGDGLAGASVTVTNSSNGEVFSSLTREGGRYELANIAPGGPYKIEVSFSGYEKIVRENIFLGLGETSQQDFILLNKTTDLKEVVITTARRSLESKGGTETTVGRDKMANLPTVGRNISDFLRFVPQAKITGDGGVSIAGQNNRYNSFYIDGAVNNDVFGLAASGTNGGQSGIAPISIDAIDQFQVVISP